VLPDAGGDGSGEPDLDAPVVVLPVSRRRGWSSTPSCWSSRPSSSTSRRAASTTSTSPLTRATQRLTVVHRAPLPGVLNGLAE
jgi:hypothetical protein